MNIIVYAATYASRLSKTQISEALGISRQSSAITKTLFKKSNSSTTLGNIAQKNDSDIEDASDSEAEENTSI